MGQAGQVTQASRQSGQGTVETGTQGTPALATWKWGETAIALTVGVSSIQPCQRNPPF